MNINVTAALRKYAEEKLGVAAGSPDDAVRAAIAKSLMAKDGITFKELLDLTKEEAKPDAKDAKDAKAAAPAAPSAEEIQRMVADQVKLLVGQIQLPVPEAKPSDGLSSDLVFSKGADIRVESVRKKFKSDRKSAIVPFRKGIKGDGSPNANHGQQAQFLGRDLYHPSEFDKALAAAYYKWAINANSDKSLVPSYMRMTPLDNELIAYALREEEWCGRIKSRSIDVSYRKLDDFEVKTLLDDAISGGIEVAPVVFDNNIILYPQLYGEFFGDVSVTDIDRGRRVHSAAMLNPTFTSGIAESQAITPFDTSAFVTPFDMTVFPAVGAMEMGRDWEADAAVSLGGSILENWGKAALVWLDYVISLGDGVTQPEGFFNVSSPTSVNSLNGAGGPVTLGDWERLSFGMAKQFRSEPMAKLVYAGNDTMYSRARSMPVGSIDERRVLGLDQQSYTILGHPYRVQPSVANGRLAFVNLARYRMIRRLGLQVAITTEGRQLMLNNLRLIVLRMRWAGKQELGGSVALMTDAAA